MPGGVEGLLGFDEPEQVFIPARPDVRIIVQPEHVFRFAQLQQDAHHRVFVDVPPAFHQRIDPSGVQMGAQDGQNLRTAFIAADVNIQPLPRGAVVDQALHRADRIPRPAAVASHQHGKAQRRRREKWCCTHTG